MPGHFQLEKSLGFQGGASLQLPKKCHHVFLAKFPVCEESSCTPQWSPDAFEAPAPRESTGPAWSWATGSWSLPEAGGRGHSWKKADWNVSLISLSGCVEKVWEQISTLHLQPGASCRGITQRIWKDSTWKAFPYLSIPSQRDSGKSFHQPVLIHSQGKDLEILDFYAGSYFLLRKSGKSELHFWTKNVSCWNRVQWTGESRGFKEIPGLCNEPPPAPAGSYGIFYSGTHWGYLKALFARPLKITQTNFLPKPVVLLLSSICTAFSPPTQWN